MTNEELTQIAKMVTQMITQKPQEAPESPVSVSPVQNVQPTVQQSPDAVQANEEPADAHCPAISPEQLVEILNDVRLEVRAQFKQPWVEALNVCFQNPAAYATVDGKRRPLIDAHQVNGMIEELKKNGKFWPQVIVTALTPDGGRRFVNTSFKRPAGENWKLGNPLKPQVEIAK